MVFGGIVASPRGSLSPLQALRLANIYLEDATKEQDPDISIVLCHDAEVSLSQAKRVVKNSSSHTILQGIATAYVDLGNILQSRGRPVEAKASYKKAEKLG
ncbi:hypothetical protein B0O80DRAFT_431582 [Mortierella sp. GBAus27b]|nr:hypothetical protein B0O80DRAFT_431582 [Mortierella sp. GBAus27b]